MTITEMMAELRAAQAHYETMNHSAVTDRATRKLLNTEARLSKAINATPSASLAELRLKLELLLYWMSDGDKWIDRRDKKLTESMMADFDRLTA